MNQGLPGASQTKSSAANLQKKGSKLTLHAGNDDSIKISQSENSLKIQINQDPELTLNPDESRNLQLTGNLDNITIDSSVTIPIKGVAQEIKPDAPVKESGSRKDERAFTGQMTREILVSELKSYMAEQGDVPVAKNTSSEAPPKEEIAMNLQTLRAPDADAGPMQSLAKQEIAPEENDFTPIATEIKEQTSLTATIKKKDLSTELGITDPTDVVQPEAQTAAMMPQELLRVKAAPPQNSIGKQELSHFVEGKPLTVTEKADLIEKLSTETKFSVFEERGIHAMISDCRNESELHSILPDFPAFQIGHSLRDPEMKISWDRMVAAFGRPELALNPQEASAFAGLLLRDPQELQAFTPGCIPHLLAPETYADPAQILDQRSFVCLVLENKSREVHQQPFVQASDLRQSALEIISDESLNADEKSFRLEQLKEDSGLTDFQMHEIVTRPLGNILQMAIQDLHTERHSVLQIMDAKVQEASETFGPESVAVEITRAEHQETLEHLESREVRLTDFQVVAEAAFAGPRDPLIKADRVMENVLNTFFPAQQIVHPEINKIFEGAVSFQTGTLEHALARTIPSFVPELRPFVQPASLFLQNIRNGTLPALLLQLSKQPAITKETSLNAQVVSAAKFLAQLATGTFTRQIQSALQVLSEPMSPPLENAFDRIQEWRAKVSASIHLDDRKMLLEAAGPLQQELFDTLQANLQTFSTKASSLLEDHRFHAAMEMGRAGSESMIAFRNAHFSQMLSALHQRLAGNAAVKQIIEQGLHIINGGTPFFRGLFNREWERPVFSALKKGSSSKELQEVPGIFSDALNLFLPLTSIEDSNPFLEYQKQLSYLKDEELMDDWIHQYRSTL